MSDKPAPAPVLVRPAEERDIEAMVRIMDATWAATWVPYMPPHVPATYAAQELGRAFVTRSWQMCRVAEQQGRVAGFTFLSGNEVKTLQVDPTTQGKGIGRALMADAEKVILAGGHDTVRVEADVFNARAAAFYRALGYGETGRVDSDILGYKVATHVFEKRPA